MVLCCICGEPFEEDDRVLRLTTYNYRLTQEKNPTFVLLRARFDNGSEEQFSHLTCPVEAGAPMSLIGADGERTDV